MRRLLVAFGLVGLAIDAHAADLPTLRGSDSFLPSTPGYVRWEGFYIGGDVTYGTAHGDFSTSTEPLLAYALRNTTIGLAGLPQLQALGTADTQAGGGGVYLGYNWQFDDAIIGVELNYTHNRFTITAPNNPIALSNYPASDGPYDVLVSGNATMDIKDFAVLRARAGWVVSSFLPYATFGFAVGRADMSLSATTTFQGETFPPPVPTPGCYLAPCTVTASQTKTSAFIYGYAAGGGVDWAMTSNLFARAEYEYIEWSPLWQIHAHMSMARLGLGLKF